MKKKYIKIIMTEYGKYFVIIIFPIITNNIKIGIKVLKII